MFMFAAGFIYVNNWRKYFRFKLSDKDIFLSALQTSGVTGKEDFLFLIAEECFITTASKSQNHL